MSDQLAEPARDVGGRFVAAHAARSPERTVLAEAIARRSAAEARLQRIEAAEARAGQMAREAYREEDRATAALSEAREAEPRWLADSILADREAGTSPPRAAEAAAANAREQREAARNAESVLRQEVDSARTAVDYAGRAVRRAAAAVLAASPAVAASIARLEAAEAELVAAGDQLRWLTAVGVVDTRTTPPGGWRDNSDEMEQRARRAERRLDVPPSGWLRERPAATERWAAALAALENDADAPCP